MSTAGMMGKVGQGYVHGDSSQLLKPPKVATTGAVSSWGVATGASPSVTSSVAPSAQANTIESPVSVHEGKVHLKESEMEIGKFYLTTYKNHTLAMRKLSNGRIEVYGLPG